MQNAFIHLHVHSEYSLIDGICRIKTMAARARALGMQAIALTDQSNAFAVVKFYKAARACGIKPILGAEVYVKNPDDAANPWHLVLLCQNNQGYKNLTELLSRAYLEGQVCDKPQVDKTWLAECNDGLIGLSGGQRGVISATMLNTDKPAALQQLAFFKTIYPDAFYLEVSRIHASGEYDYIQQLTALAGESNTPVVATNNVRFLEPEDFNAHEARVCIHDGYTLDDPRRPKSYTQEQYLASPEVMCERFKDIPSAIENTLEITKRCNVSLQLGENFLPDFPVPEGISIGDFLAEESKRGLENRLAVLSRSKSESRLSNEKDYFDRLTLELAVINSMGFPGYFLIVADFIQWAKNNGVPVGPGRGSGAGSLVAYALGITDIDPLEYDLLFERFLNPERVSMPDFDIDFCMEGRDRVIDYVAQKYGRDAVSQIITYGTMAAKAVIRDVGRVLGHPYGFVDKIAKLIPFEIGITLDKALAQEDELQQRYHQEEEVKALIDLAKKLEGITRNAGKHAGGVVIAPSKLTDFAPLYCEAGGESLVTQFDKDDVESVGLVKFDFLGLRTLTIIQWALNNIKLQFDKTIDINLIPVDDAATFVLLKACNTTAVFQLESRGMKDLIKRLQPDCFEDIIALVALFRPGPLQSGMVDDFIDRKHGRAKVEYPHDELEPILKPTYGVILYQEQVMQIAQVLAGYTLGAADLLRRAMGKKKPEEMAKQRSIFTEGAKARGVAEKTATSIFDLMEKFAGYGFNKSHSAAYALVAYQTAWLKAHYHAAFMAAVLSSDMDNTDKVVGFLEDCKTNAINVLPPDINHGRFMFTVVDDATIRYGLGAIKGVGEAAIVNMIAIRNEQGDYQDLFNFVAMQDTRKINRRVLEALIKSGALDCFKQNRATLMASTTKALKRADQQQKNNKVGQHDLFGNVFDASGESESIDYTQQPAWHLPERLKAEKDTLGHYVSGHPVDQYQHEIQHWRSTFLANLNQFVEQSVVVTGLVKSARALITKRGDKMCVFTVDDTSGVVDIVAFSETYAAAKSLIEKDRILTVEGVVGVDDFSGGYRLLANRVYDVAGSRARFATYCLLQLQADDKAVPMQKALAATLREYRGGATPVCLHYCTQDFKASFIAGESWNIEATDECLAALKQVLGDANVSMFYATM